MNWTHTSLGKRGFFGTRPLLSLEAYHRRSRSFEAVICEESFVAKLGEDGEKDLDTFPGQWTGPIEIPE